MSSDALPPHAALLLAFANTVDVDEGTEALPEPGALASWLREHGLLTGEERADARDLALALRLRAGLRAAFAAHHEPGGGQPPPELDAASAQLPLRLVVEAAGPALRPLNTGVRGALAALLVAVAGAAADGSWQRLKLCPADTCQWGFYDASKNRARTWCSMRVCGNREKTRTYRERQRATSA